LSGLGAGMAEEEAAFLISISIFIFLRSRFRGGPREGVAEEDTGAGRRAAAEGR